MNSFYGFLPFSYSFVFQGDNGCLDELFSSEGSFELIFEGVFEGGGVDGFEEFFPLGFEVGFEVLFADVSFEGVSFLENRGPDLG